MQSERIRGSPGSSRQRRVMESRKHRRFGAMAVLLSVLAGCDSADDRLVRLATESTNRQAAQSQEMLRLQQQVAEGTKQLVANDSAARREWIEVKRALQTDFAEVGKQRDALEAERKTLDASRHRDPVIAAAIETFGFVLACLAPLLAALYALRQQASGASDSKVTSFLLHEVVASRQRSLSCSPPRPLPSPEDDLPF
jgi:hypothetical protein